MLFLLQSAPWAPRASLMTRQTRSKLKNRKVHFWDFYVENHFWWKTDLLSFLFLKMNSAIRFLFKKASFRHFARNVTIVSPNGGPGGTNHSKCEKHNFPSFCPKVTFLLQKCILGLFLAFWDIFILLAPNDPKIIKKPLLPQAFEPLGPKNAFWAPKCAKY